MRQTIVNFLQMEVETEIPLIYWGLLVVWLFIVVAGVSSVLSRPWEITGKLVWILLIVGLPLVGMVFYCVYSLFRADYSFLQQFGLALGGKKPSAKVKTSVPNPAHRQSMSS